MSPVNREPLRATLECWNGIPPCPALPWTRHWCEVAVHDPGHASPARPAAPGRLGLIALVGHLLDFSIDPSLRSHAATPPAPNPVRQSPHPPARDLHVVEVGIGLHFPAMLHPPLSQPRVPRGQVLVDRRPRGPIGDGFRVGPQGPPEVAQQPVQVAHNLAGARLATVEQHGQRPGERFGVDAGIAQPVDQMRSAHRRFPPYQGKGARVASPPRVSLRCVRRPPPWPHCIHVRSLPAMRPLRPLRLHALAAALHALGLP